MTEPIRLHPDDYATVSRRIDGVNNAMGLVGPSARITAADAPLVADPTAERGVPVFPPGTEQHRLIVLLYMGVA